MSILKFVIVSRAKLSPSSIRVDDLFYTVNVSEDNFHDYDALRTEMIEEFCAKYPSTVDWNGRHTNDFIQHYDYNHDTVRLNLALLSTVNNINGYKVNLVYNEKSGTEIKLVEPILVEVDIDDADEDIIETNDDNSGVDTNNDNDKAVEAPEQPAPAEPTVEQPTDDVEAPAESDVEAPAESKPKANKDKVAKK